MARKKFPEPAPEWSFPVDADKIAHTPQVFTIHPNPAECKALALRLGIKTLKDLTARIEFVREPGKMTIQATGSFEAHVLQDCVVSGKPVESRIKDTFKAWYADAGKAILLAKARHDKLLQKGNAEMPVLDESEDPEPLVDGHIDAGELVTQYLSLSIDPYPHADGVVYESGDEAENAAGSRLENPFAALKDWKNRQGKE